MLIKNYLSEESLDWLACSDEPLLILSLCFNDVPFAVANLLSILHKNRTAYIVTDKASLHHEICNLLKLETGSIEYFSYVRCCIDISDEELTSSSSLLLFTLGTHKICKMVLRAIDLKIRVYYADCYYSDFLSVYDYRLSNPFGYLFNYRRPFGDITKRGLAKQILKQIIFDSTRSKLHFSANSQCWLTRQSLSKLQPVKQCLNYDIYTKTHISPPRSIVFALSKYDTLPNFIDWSFWSRLKYNLYYKPHPNVSLDYQCYPPYVQPIWSGVSAVNLFVREDSFLVASSSTILRYSRRSISILSLIDASPSDLDQSYAACAAYQPKTLPELQSLLISKQPT